MMGDGGRKPRNLRTAWICRESRVTSHESLLVRVRNARNAYPGCGHLVTLVDRDQHRRQCLDCDRIRERPGVPCSQPRVAGESHDRLPRRVVVAADQHVTVDLVVGILEMPGGYVLECRY